MSSNNKSVEPCLSCKIISISCLCGIGTYLIHVARSQKNLSKYTLFMLATGSFGLGIGEIFGKSPFRNIEAQDDQHDQLRFK